MKSWLCVVLLVAAPTVFADTVTSVSCSVYGVPTVTDPHNCSLTGIPAQFYIPGFASATANASFGLSSDPGSFSSLSVQQSTAATPDNPPTPPSHPSGAGSQVSVNETLFTTGNVRSGFVQMSATGYSSHELRGGSADVGLSLGPVQVVCFDNSSGGPISNCTLFPNPRRDPPSYVIPPFGDPVQVEYPFTLGQAFQFSYSGNLIAITGPGPGDTGGASASMQFQFRFFEADGVTPVAVESVPEPGTLALFGVALGILAAGKKKLQC